MALIVYTPTDIAKAIVILAMLAAFLLYLFVMVAAACVDYIKTKYNTWRNKWD